MSKIHVGFLMSYDYIKLKTSIPPIYKEADKIFLALDSHFRTWKGETFEVKKEFFEWIKDYDKENKIIFYRDNFYKPELSTIQNDTRERFMLSQKMGKGNWIIQIDADEIFIDFKKFVQTLKRHNNFLVNPVKRPVQIAGYLINIYKYLDNGILYVEQPTKVLLATNYPNYKVARKTKERIIYTDNILLHECLSRTEEELKFKFKNWGHSHQINNKFFEKWKKANEINYKSIKNIFYLNPELWKTLGYFETKDLNEIKNLIKNKSNLKISRWYLFKKNFGQWFKHLKIFRKDRDFEKYF
ncbi:hypothetical protein [Mesoflavibacter zeaxanthinifaciens]|uniref:hypothetical protein n=1 Tax=Mesoflavibacter zeaxanthinifaciens TaxID=393060 RepID=UPI0026EF901D|nr:hypothetical protein [Mesoflavibacter zeaxanthinifaciens]